MWTLPQLVAKAEIIAAVCFTKYTLYLYRSTPGVLQITVSRLSNSKACLTWIKKDVMYDGIRPKLILPTVKEIIQGNSYFTLHFDETVSAQVKKHMDLFACYWSEESKEIKMRYLASIMLGHAKADTVVHEILLI